jgi:hypothetical protein
MVAGIPAHLSGIDPAFEAEGHLDGLSIENVEGLGAAEIFGSATVLDGVLTGREGDMLAVGAIDLGMEEEIAAEAFGLGGIDATPGVADEEAGGGGLVTVVEDAEGDLGARLDGEQDVDFVTEAEVLGALTDVEGEFGLALAVFAGEDLEDPVFEFESGEMDTHGLFVEHGHVHPFSADEALGLVGELAHVGAVGGEHGGDAGFVVDLDEESAPALLDEFGGGVALLDFDAAFGVDVDADEGVFVEEALEGFDLVRAAGAGVKDLANGGGIVGGEGFTDEVERLEDAMDLSGEGLEVDFGDEGEVFGARRGGVRSGDNGESEETTMATHGNRFITNGARGLAREAGRAESGLS